MFDIADIFVTMFIGVFGTMFLAGIVAFVFGVITHLTTTICIAATILFVYAIGWCIKNYIAYTDERNMAANSKPAKVESPFAYKIPVLDGLEKFEKKYNISTVKFMSFVYHNVIPHNMDNLDYLEWLSLVNELPSIRSDK